MSIARRLATVACALALQGCAGALVQDDWNQQPTHPALTPYHIELAERDLARTCGDHPGMLVYGCAVRVAEANLCIIYTAPQPAAWLMVHERKHCSGWDHGPSPVMTSTTVAAAYSVFTPE